MTLKVCTRCGVALPLDAFYRPSNVWCRDCHAQDRTERLATYVRAGDTAAVLSEEEFLGIVERAERALLGDKSVLTQLINIDMLRLLSYVRELQRQLGERAAP